MGPGATPTVAGFALLIACTACSPDVTAPSPSVERVDLQPYFAQLTVGDTVRFHATGLRWECDLEFCGWGVVPDARFTWHLRNSTVAVFVTSPAGRAALVRAVGSGETWVVADAQSASDSTRILVSSP